MKNFFFIKCCVVLCFSIVGANSGSSQVRNSAYIPSGYELVFSDEFDNAATKNVNWKPDSRDTRGTDWNTYGVIENGVMKLKNLKIPKNDTTLRWSAPSCQGKKYYKYGYFECRYKYAASIGFNNSFWMLGAPQMSKDYIEIDINEGQVDEGGQRNKASWLAAGGLLSLDQVRPMTLDHGNGNCTRPAYFYTSTDLSADFHTYGFLWTPDTLSYYFDGKLLLKHPNKRVYKNEPVYRLLNYPMNIYLSTLNYTYKAATATMVESSMDIDYVRVYQIPGLIDEKPPVSGGNLLKNSGFGAYDDEHYGGGLYSWNSAVGGVDSLFYSSTLTAARTSPMYAPNQNINVLPAGDYNLTFKARVMDTTLNTASWRLKISNSDNLSASVLSKLTSVSGGGGVSGTEVLINKSHAPVFKSFSYRFTVKEPSASATYTRVMFYQNNPKGAATFQLDDVVISPVGTPVINEVKTNVNAFGGVGSISVRGDLTGLEISVYNPSGMLVKQLSGENAKHFPMEKGVYFVRVKNGKSLSLTFKVVVV